MPVPLQNRVAPTGALEAVEARGLMMGNRGGQFHRPEGRLGLRRWASRAWIACRLEWKGRHEDIWADRHYTQLFFLDEATALAAGHRPCALCRRADFNRFAALWGAVEGQNEAPRVATMDDVLHRQRWASRGRSSEAPVAASSLPDGSMLLVGEVPHLVMNDRIWRWTFEGYCSEHLPAAEIEGTPITPPAIRRVLAAGYRPMLHPSTGPRAGSGEVGIGSLTPR
ncbi:MAG: hypothetical protein R3D57_00205 [Hyphomicrobiaceae bacterium]